MAPMPCDMVGKCWQNAIVMQMGRRRELGERGFTSPPIHLLGATSSQARPDQRPSRSALHILIVNPFQPRTYCASASGARGMRLPLLAALILTISGLGAYRTKRPQEMLGKSVTNTGVMFLAERAQGPEGFEHRVAPPHLRRSLLRRDAPWPTPSCRRVQKGGPRRQ